MNQGSDAQDPAALGLYPGASLYEMVRDGLVVSEEKEVEEKPAVNGSSKPNGKSKKSAPAPPTAKKSTVKIVQSTTRPFSESDDWTSSPLSQFHARPVETPNPPAALKTLTVSTWNPPPPQYRARGHLVYLALTTLEGESVQITGTVRGWFVSKSTSVTFDPTPRSAPKDVQAHSLIDLLHGLSSTFTGVFHTLLAGGGATSSIHPPREILATAPIQQALPAHPWLVKPQAAHVPDSLRQQLAYLHTGAVGVEGLEAARDWNDELQQGRELGKETMQEKVNREKHLARVHAEFTNACVRGVVSVARGDVIPLNPHEKSDAHMFFYHNILFTKGCDSIDSFSHLGGDAAAHAASGKDAAGIKALNQLDVEGVCCLGHTVVDWAGERWVCQTYLPGIFSKRLGVDEENKTEDAAAEDKKDTSNPLIVYGLDFEAGPTSIKWDASFHKSMEKIAEGFRLAKHEVASTSAASGEDKKVELWSSFDVKGLLGTDGRKYVLDAFRLSPVDVEFLQKDLEGFAFTSTNVADRTGALQASESDETAVSDKTKEEDEAIAAYPHRLVLLRQELLDTFWETEFRKWATDRASKREKKPKAPAAVEAAPAESTSEEAAKSDETKEDAPAAAEETKPEEERVVVQLNGDVHVHQPTGEVEIIKAEPGDRFDLKFNPDAWVDLKAGPSEEGKDLIASSITDESDPAVKAVRDASVFLRSTVIPTFVLDVLTNRDSSIDGVSLTRSLHRRGINMRYVHVVSLYFMLFREPVLITFSTRSSADTLVPSPPPSRRSAPTVRRARPSATSRLSRSSSSRRWSSDRASGSSARSSRVSSLTSGRPSSPTSSTASSVLRSRPTPSRSSRHPPSPPTRPPTGPSSRLLRCRPRSSPTSRLDSDTPLPPPTSPRSSRRSRSSESSPADSPSSSPAGTTSSRSPLSRESLPRRPPRGGRPPRSLVRSCERPPSSPRMSSRSFLP